MPSPRTDGSLSVVLQGLASMIKGHHDDVVAALADIQRAQHKMLRRQGELVERLVAVPARGAPQGKGSMQDANALREMSQQALLKQSMLHELLGQTDVPAQNGLYVLNDDDAPKMPLEVRLAAASTETPHRVCGDEEASVESGRTARAEDVFGIKGDSEVEKTQPQKTEPEDEQAAKRKEAAQERVQNLIEEYDEQDEEVWADLVLKATKLPYKWRKRLSPRKHGCLVTFANSNFFRYCNALVILTNAVFIAVTTQYAMDEMTHSTPAHFFAVEVSFCLYFTLELLIRVWQERAAFVFSNWWKWNVFDTSLVVMALVDMIMAVMAAIVTSDNDSEGENLTFLRVLRLLKMMRVIRIVRALRFFTLLRKYVDQIFGSMLGLLWLFVVLFVILYIFAIAFVQATMTHLEETNQGRIQKTVHAVRLYTLFKSVPDAMLTLFKCIGGGEDWGKVEISLGEVGVGYKLLFLFFYFFSVLGVMNIVTGLFCESAAENSRIDRAEQAREEYQIRLKRQNQIKTLFQGVDTDDSGVVDKKEFDALLENRAVMKYFSQMELDRNEVMTLFVILDADGTGAIDIEEFTEGLMYIKHGATKEDLAMLILEHRRLALQFGHFRDAVEKQLGIGKGRAASRPQRPARPAR